MNWFSRLHWSIVGPVIVMTVGLVLMLTSPAGFRVETQTVSLQVASLALSPEVSDEVALVDIDQRSLDAVGPWPWPRTQIAQVIQAVHEAGASTILVALDFEGPDAAAPQRAVEAWASTFTDTNAENLLAELPDTNQVLLDVMADTGAILALGRARDGGNSAALTPTVPIMFSQEGGETFVPLASARAVDLIAAQAIASQTIATAPLGLRRDFLGRPSGIYPVLSLDGSIVTTSAMAPLYGDAAEVIIETAGVPGTLGFVDPVGMVHVSIGETIVPTLADGTLLLRRNISAPWFSASNVLDGSQAAPLHGRTVIIGSSLDVLAPTNGSWIPALSNARALTAAAAQVLSQSTPQRPFVLSWVEIMLGFMGGVLIILIGLRKRLWLAMGVAFVLTIALFAAAAYLLSTYNILFDATAVGLLLIFTAAFTMSGLENSPQSVRARFGHAVEGKLPFGVPSKLLRNPKKLLETADSRKISVLCCTIRDFDELQDLYKDDPEGLTAILHSFHEMVGDTVRSYGGTADRYGGPTMLAFWNAPLEEPDHALKACDCGLRIIDALEKLNQAIEGQSYRMGKAFSPIHLGIGINTGRSVVGNVGSPKRPDYSAVGETVALAHSLLTASANYGPAIIVGEHTYQAVKNRFALLEVDKIGVAHKNYAIRVFALLGNPVTKASPRFRALEEAHASIFEAYRNQNWAMAEALIRECRKLNGAIPSLYDLYEHRIGYYRQFPPESEWDGSFKIPVV